MVLTIANIWQFKYICLDFTNYPVLKELPHTFKTHLLFTLKDKQPVAICVHRVLFANITPLFARQRACCKIVYKALGTCSIATKWDIIIYE